MSLNCLSCQVFQRTNSDLERNNYGKGFLSANTERSWSGNLVAKPPCNSNNKNKDIQMKSEQVMAVSRKKVKTLLGHHRRLHCSGTESFEGINKEPRLVRSCGMRRDWSFEDLSGRAEKKGRTI